MAPPLSLSSFICKNGDKGIIEPTGSVGAQNSGPDTPSVLNTQDAIAESDLGASWRPGERVLGFQKGRLGAIWSLLLRGTFLIFPCLCSSTAGLDWEIEGLPGSCREGHVGQWRALLWVVRVKAVGVVHLGRNSLEMSLGAARDIPAWPPSLSLWGSVKTDGEHLRATSSIPPCTS